MLLLSLLLLTDQVELLLSNLFVLLQLIIRSVFIAMGVTFGIVIIVIIIVIIYLWRSISSRSIVIVDIIATIIIIDR